MARIDYPHEVRVLIAELKRLPGVGPKSAERMALWLLRERGDAKLRLAGALGSSARLVRACDRCGFFATDQDGCPACVDSRRDSTLVCVVEQASDVLPLERSGAFNGHYHVLGGRLAPLDDIGPEDLRIAALVNRLRNGSYCEVVLALSSDVEGEATANYLAGILQPLQVTVTRLAQGLPAGGGLEYADALTLARALAGRGEV